VTTAEHQPITPDEADDLFAPLKSFHTVLVAVSGGADSFALLHLIAEWHDRHAQNTPHVFAATVDHQLRIQSATEAEIVKARCATLGIYQTTLCWDAKKPWSGVASAARDARYALLEAEARNRSSSGPAAIITAHTIDDQAETVVMRLKRGSGVNGLAAMPSARPVSPGSPITLVRPLLTIPKTRLIATLEVRGLTWCEDPSNADHASERVRIRRTMNILRERGIDAQAFAAVADRMQSAREALIYAERNFENSLAIKDTSGFLVSLDRTAFDAGPAYLRQQVLVRLIERHRGDSPAPELSEIEALVKRLDDAEDFGGTLGGVHITANRSQMILGREHGRISEKPALIKADTTALWDRRFTISRSGSVSCDVHVSALGTGKIARDTRTKLEQLQLATCPAWAVAALPAFYVAGENVVAAPEATELNGILFRFVTADLVLEAKSVP
jgi:tRNA(Ile)-lysidine synthase